MERFKRLDSFSLKILALVTMLIDHTGMVFYPENMLFRYIGRISFPLYAFLLAEGYVHTKNLKKYCLRLFCFAMLSEVPFDMAVCHGDYVNFSHQNVIFTFLIGILVLWCIDKNRMCPWVQIMGVLAGMFLAVVLRTDYQLYGIGMIVAFYYFREEPLMQFAGFAFSNVMMFQKIQNAALFAAIPIYLYNGKQGRKLKYLFYVMYPLHLFLFGWLKYHWKG